MDAPPKNTLIYYFKPGCPACVAATPVIDLIPDALAKDGYPGIKLLKIDTNTIDVANAVGGRIMTVPKIIFVKEPDNVFIYPSTRRTVDLIVTFIKNIVSNKQFELELNGGVSGNLKNDGEVSGGQNVFSSLGSMINNLFTTLRGGSRIRVVRKRRRSSRSKSRSRSKSKSKRRRHQKRNRITKK